jgi:ribosomal protein S18 acetylase RimI-like enzyme
MLRTIEESDTETIYKLNQSIFKDEIIYDKEYLNRLCKLKQGYIINHDDIPAGYLLYGMTRCKNNRLFTVISIGVEDKYRKNRYGTNLMNKLIEQYSDKEISLHVRVKNIIAQKLYTNMGFKITDTEKGYYPSLNDDAYHMVRPAHKN